MDATSGMGVTEISGSSHYGTIKYSHHRNYGRLTIKFEQWKLVVS